MNGGPLSPGPVQPAAASKRALPESSCVSLVQSSPDAMNGEPLQRRVIITNPMGFHFRPMGAFAKLASTFQSTITVRKEDRRVDGKSILELMLLAAEQGSELTIEASGPDAVEAVDALAEVVAAPGWEDEPEAPLPPKG